MPAGPVGSSWKAGSWSDTAWEAGTWADRIVRFVHGQPWWPLFQQRRPVRRDVDVRVVGIVARFATGQLTTEVAVTPRRSASLEMWGEVGTVTVQTEINPTAAQLATLAELQRYADGSGPATDLATDLRHLVHLINSSSDPTVIVQSHGIPIAQSLGSALRSLRERHADVEVMDHDDQQLRDLLHRMTIANGLLGPERTAADVDQELRALLASMKGS